VPLSIIDSGYSSGPLTCAATRMSPGDGRGEKTKSLVVENVNVIRRPGN